MQGKKFYWLAFIALLVLATDIYFYGAKQEGTPKNSEIFFGKSPASKAENSFHSTVTDLQHPQAKNPPHTSSNYLTPSPEDDEKQIIERAAKLSPQEIQDLKTNSLDTSLNQDLRFESVYLLSQNQKSEKELAEIVLTPIPNSLKNRMLDFENVLRAQAIEGIQNSANKQTSQKLLTEIIKKSDNTFLIERSQRAQLYLQNGGEDLKTQDQKKLKAIINE